MIISQGKPTKALLAAYVDEIHTLAKTLAVNLLQESTQHILVPYAVFTSWF